MREGTENAWILITAKSIKVTSKFNSSVATKWIMGKKKKTPFSFQNWWDFGIAEQERATVCVCVCVCVKKEC